MRGIVFIQIVVFSLMSMTVYGQQKKFNIHTVAFYNLENLFDTINDPTKYDEASPIMEMNAGRAEVYKKKVHNMAKVIADIGKEDTNNSPVVIGVSEIENRDVLEDLINDPQLISKNYGIEHYNSPDGRGIDVALLYQKSVFKPVSSSNHVLKIFDDSSGKRVFTRDQLLVSGYLDGEMMHFIVNHWPSRRGGEARSRSKRVAAAKLSKRIIDSLQSTDPYVKIFTMGDLNDDPTNASVKKELKAVKNIDEVKPKGIYNPMENMKRKGLGSNAYRDSWSLFDQIMVTYPLIDKSDYDSYRFYKAGIFSKNYLINKKGRYKGYPYRSFANGSFTGGYSDHFPVYAYIIKEIK